MSTLEAAGIGLGVITNHNKFDAGEFRALRKRARKSGIGLLPGVELSVNDGANGVHTLVVFSEEWIENGQDHINPFLTSVFAGKTPDQYEHENGRCNHDLITTLQKLEAMDRDFFIVFAHVEAASGLWHEVAGGKMEALAQHQLIKKYCLGFQKVRTHDTPSKPNRVKVKSWWGDIYPAELEGCDAKNLDEIGRGKACYLQIGEFSFDAVKYALTEPDFRVRPDDSPHPEHSRIDAIRFEGGVFDGKRVAFSPHLNCLIGIQGSGKSSVLECLRYGLNIDFGEKAQDRDYKDELIPFVLRSGGKIVIEATDRLGTQFEIRRILDHQPEVYINDELQPGVSITETIVRRPLYFGQKDLSAAGKEFGRDLVEKLVGDELAPYRDDIAEKEAALKDAIENLNAVQTDSDQLAVTESELKDVTFRLDQFDKHGVKGKLDKQVDFGNDVGFCESVEQAAQAWLSDIESSVESAIESFSEIEAHESKYNGELFQKYNAKLEELKQSTAAVSANVASIESLVKDLDSLKTELVNVKDGLKEEFAEIERELVKALASQGVTSIEPTDYIRLAEKKSELEAEITELKRRTSKRSEKLKAVDVSYAALNDSWHAEYKFIAAELGKINAAQPSLQIDAGFKGDKEKFRGKMEDTFRGSNIRHEAYGAISDAYADFGDIYKDLDKASENAKSLSHVYIDFFVSNLAALLTYQVPNRYDVTYNGKPLRSHSLGQRASAMMLFLLSQEDNDLLLVDQPEDDLDSQTVYEEVVKLVRRIKTNRQFIFATHNANFPVLGDAESVTACHVEDEVFSLASGSVDSKECQSKIIKIMEGGPEAFERRRSIYQIWKASDVSQPDL